ncbi:MAG: MaoC family dehydratase [Actinomycetota bacterium]|nr:MAG: MaoC family dehydratase [Actinomycetota bacterium]
MKHLTTEADIRAAAGTHLGVSDWLDITQEMVDTFAEVTGDRQWIHVDVARAAQGPFGGTIAHGFLTLSLLPALTAGAFVYDGTRMNINYGLNKVRFITPVVVGSRVRSSTDLLEVTEVDGGLQVVMRTTIEIEGGSRPAAVAEHVQRAYF